MKIKDILCNPSYPMFSPSLSINDYWTAFDTAVKNLLESQVLGSELINRLQNCINMKYEAKPVEARPITVQLNYAYVDSMFKRVEGPDSDRLYWRTSISLRSVRISMAKKQNLDLGLASFKFEFEGEPKSGDPDLLEKSVDDYLQDNEIWKKNRFLIAATFNFKFISEKFGLPLASETIVKFYTTRGKHVYGAYASMDEVRTTPEAVVFHFTYEGPKRPERKHLCLALYIDHLKAEVEKREKLSALVVKGKFDRDFIIKRFQRPLISGEDVLFETQIRGELTIVVKGSSDPGVQEYSFRYSPESIRKIKRFKTASADLGDFVEKLEIEAQSYQQTILVPGGVLRVVEKDESLKPVDTPVPSKTSVMCITKEFMTVTYGPPTDFGSVWLWTDLKGHPADIKVQLSKNDPDKEVFFYVSSTEHPFGTDVDTRALIKREYNAYLDHKSKKQQVDSKSPEIVRVSAADDTTPYSLQASLNERFLTEKYGLGTIGDGNTTLTWMVGKDLKIVTSTPAQASKERVADLIDASGNSDRLSNLKATLESEQVLWYQKEKALDFVEAFSKVLKKEPACAYQFLTIAQNIQVRAIDGADKDLYNLQVLFKAALKGFQK